MPHRWTRWIIATLGCVALALNGCSLQCWRLYDCPDPPAYEEDLILKYAGRGLKIEDPERNVCEDDSFPSVPVSPDTAVSGEVKYKNLSLQEAVETALANSQVMKDLGGVLRSPAALATIYDPARTYTDGRFGEEAALSAFDASFGASAYFEQNDYGVNNVTVGQNGLFKQDYNNYEMSLQKKSVTGATFTLRNVTQYDNNNQEASFITNPFVFGQSWTNYAEAQWRQPLLQGAGVMYNRIAGPNGEPGFANGVLVARTRTDISLADFEIAVRNLVSDTENAYWDLYYAYRDLDAKVEARDNALRVWQNVQANAGQGRRTADQEGQAREQYYRFESEVINALHGRLTPRTQTNYGSNGGTFIQNGGVRVSERRLRVIMAVEINGQQLLRPDDDPPVAQVKFDWDAIALEAVARRPELRRQKWVIKQRELELIANKNFLKPQLDLVARYRLRGFGKDLWGYDQPQYDNAIQSMMDRDFQEYQMGVEFDMPIGFRRGHAAVRSSELALAREKAILREQENFIMYGLSNTYGEIERAHQVMEAQFNRREAAYAQQRAVEASHEAGFAPLDLLLEAQRRVIDANILFYQARVDYAQAIKNVHYEKGSLLEHNNIYMAEGPWPQKAYNDALQRDLNKRHALTNFVINDAVIGRPKKVDFSLEPSKKPYKSTPIFEGPAFPETSEADTTPENPLRQEKSETPSVQQASADNPLGAENSPPMVSEASNEQEIDFGGEEPGASAFWISR